MGLQWGKKGKEERGVALTTSSGLRHRVNFVGKTKTSPTRGHEPGLFFPFTLRIQSTKSGSSSVRKNHQNYFVPPRNVFYFFEVSCAEHDTRRRAQVTPVRQTKASPSHVHTLLQAFGLCGRSLAAHFYALESNQRCCWLSSTLVGKKA